MYSFCLIAYIKSKAQCVQISNFTYNFHQQAVDKNTKYTNKEDPITKLQKKKNE